MDATAGTRLVEALAARDEDAIAACFALDAELRALVPPGVRERTGAAEIAALLRSWFADSTVLELAEVQTEPVGDRLRVTYRFRGVEDGEPYVVEQHLFCTVGEQGIERADLLCSGFRPPV
jgi:hypothetical protein